MAEIILISGGCRSGKSSYAEKMLENSQGRKLYLATAPVLDSEMEDRIRRHKERRVGKNWDTVEEEVALAETLSKYKDYDNILVDCLTLWINNLMYRAELSNEELNESKIADIMDKLLLDLQDIDVKIIFIINEVGMGIVPENKTARLFRDLSGRCAQKIAAEADTVIMMSCGLPLMLKQKV